MTHGHESVLAAPKPEEGPKVLQQEPTRDTGAEDEHLHKRKRISYDNAPGSPVHGPTVHHEPIGSPPKAVLPFEHLRQREEEKTRLLEQARQQKRHERQREKEREMRELKEKEQKEKEKEEKEKKEKEQKEKERIEREQKIKELRELNALGEQNTQHRLEMAEKELEQRRKQERDIQDRQEPSPGPTSEIPLFTQDGSTEARQHDVYPKHESDIVSDFQEESEAVSQLRYFASELSSLSETIQAAIQVLPSEYIQDLSQELRNDWALGDMEFMLRGVISTYQRGGDENWVTGPRWRKRDEGSAE